MNSDAKENSEMRPAFARAILLATMVCILVLPARAEVRILASPGGQVGPFLDLFERIRDSGERVVIDGPCLSACTLVLSMVPTERICVTRRAILGFHAARSMDRRGRMYRAGSLRGCAGGLSFAGAKLDPPPRRIDLAPAVAARP
jgi:hypothetical protein